MSCELRIPTCWTLLLFLLVLPAMAKKHIGMSWTDKFIECATGVFGKPVFVTVWKVPDSNVRCLANRELLTEELRTNQLSVVENESAIILDAVLQDAGAVQICVEALGG